ncbi:ATP-binding protein [Leptolyngbya sp. FACHB-261]|uniref:ATP-binding protein n=1 Tax=Leptolyngbya sp. FACHB-261 TaxID=2692806 RepID=UPI0016849C96|nr:ATP-binding protein [Leptolyngbya sp. FACHB-261]MBD2104093.1 hypothetical protein [Leptolyngbya sp. FACHB-261]
MDRQRVVQMLLNYLSNAVKFSPKRSTITLSSRRASLQELEVQAIPETMVKQTPYFLVLSVSDTGIGIPTEKHHLLFQTFQQVNGEISRVYGGTGLGLALTRSLAELHGGGVLFTSVPGRGSTFLVWLPLKTEFSNEQGGKFDLNPQ